MVPIDVTSLVQQLKGRPIWLETALYAATLGARLGLGYERPSSPELVGVQLRLSVGPESIYSFSGDKIEGPTAFIEESFLNNPVSDAELRRCAECICGIFAHEAAHHRALGNVLLFCHHGHELEEGFSPDLRLYFLEQLDVRQIMRVTGAPQANLLHYWAASPEQWLITKKEKNREATDLKNAAFDARAEFLCQVTACLARHHLLRGAGYARSLVDAIIAAGKVPSPLPVLLAQTIDAACSVNAESDTLQTVQAQLSSNKYTTHVDTRNHRIQMGEWPSDFSKTFAEIRHKNHPGNN